MKPTDIRIVAVEPLAVSRWLNLFQVTYCLDGRNTRSWTLASRLSVPRCQSGRFDRPDAVIIVPYHVGQARLVVTRELRVALGGDEYGFPAGLLEPGESVEDTARRELKEETGLRVVRILRVSPPLYSSAGMTDEAFTLVYVECDGEAADTGCHAGERIQTLFVSPQEARCLCADPSVKFDAKAWLVMAHFADTGGL